MADVASSFKNWSASPASNQPTSATVIGSGLAPNLQQIQATLRTELGARSASITAASTVDLNTVDEGTVEVEHISGAVNVSSFGNVQAGIKKLVTFSVTSGSLTLVYNATSMIIPSAANISVENGDSLFAESLGSGNWKVHHYTKADGLPIVGNTTTKTSDPTLTANDSNAVSSDWVNAKALIINGTEVSASSGTAIDFTNIPASAKRIKIKPFNISGNGSSPLIVQLGYGATPTFVNTGYLAWGVNFSTGSLSGASISNGIPFINSMIAADNHSGLMDLDLVSGNKWAGNGMLASESARGGLGSGGVELPGPLTAVRITFANGTQQFDGSGTINYSVEY